MRNSGWFGWALTGVLVAASAVCAQQTGTNPTVSGAAAVVNGQTIPEVAVQRALRRVPPPKRNEARAEILNFLIDNALVDQYLVSRNTKVEPASVEAKVTELREAVKKQGKTTLEKALQEAGVSLDELRQQITAQLRWDAFAAEQATDARVQAYFQQHKEMFDGSTVRARHILLTPADNSPQTAEQTRAKLTSFKKQIDDEVNAELAKLPANTDAGVRESARARLTEQAFSTVASKESACPSKQHGGDLGYFPRAGMMVEPFAQAAFALKPFQVSDVVTTPFGQHLILVTDRKPGKDLDYDKVKDVVKEAYSDYLREAVAKQLRVRATITIK